VHVQVTYDRLDRLTGWRRSLTSHVTDLLVNYIYDVDNNVISVTRSDVPVTWYRDDVTSGDDDVTDGDGHVVLRRGSQRLEWNSRSQLTRVTSSHVNATYVYVYDAVGRLTVVDGVTTSLHLFYSDIRHPERVSHIHNSSTDTVTEYLYDERDGHLLAARVNGDVMLYVGVDPDGSPICVFDETGQTVRQMSYTPLGGLRHVTGGTHEPWYIGYRAAFHDTTADLLFFASRVLDPDNGRWLAPNYQSFIDRRHYSVTTFIRNSDLYETNYLRHGDVTPPSLMLSEY